VAKKKLSFKQKCFKVKDTLFKTLADKLPVTSCKPGR